MRETDCSPPIAMSIAVSAIVKPSRILGAMMLLMASLTSAVGILIGLGMIGELASSFRLATAASILILVFFGFYHGMRSRKPIQLSISGIGQIRISKWSSETPCRESNWTHVGMNVKEVRLLPESTLWPLLLLLRLEDADGGLLTVPVLPDSVSRDAFRSLSVAFRWIAANEVRSKANP
ncbi:protein YgfX [Noviherbaspirillum sp. CPCC 100848]|uniref:Protein YgfX n=1 Tax=Noviherbaspirillum album TaxID=3080276 RepID=A0ABU6JEN4_9BURK|nr:protein YgfX [Noviherbaspirillum sp. CPCC 100848]MEC4721993.1 protein YgfX [Noviherbaspirillum sp. CPCC 100848]